MHGAAPIVFGSTAGALVVVSAPVAEVLAFAPTLESLVVPPTPLALAALPLAFAEEDRSATGDLVRVRDLREVGVSMISRMVPSASSSSSSIGSCAPSGLLSSSSAMVGDSPVAKSGRGGTTHNSALLNQSFETDCIE